MWLKHRVREYNSFFDSGRYCLPWVCRSNFCIFLSCIKCLSYHKWLGERRGEYESSVGMLAGHLPVQGEGLLHGRSLPPAQGRHSDRAEQVRVRSPTLPLIIMDDRILRCNLWCVRATDHPEAPISKDFVRAKIILGSIRTRWVPCFIACPNEWPSRSLAQWHVSGEYNSAPSRPPELLQTDDDHAAGSGRIRTSCHCQQCMYVCIWYAIVTYSFRIMFLCKYAFHYIPTMEMISVVPA